MSTTEADSSKTKVYIYDGHGCSERSSLMLKTALERHVDQSYHDVKTISPEEIKTGLWTKDAALMIFGGGFDLGFIKSLGEDGIKCIHDYMWKQGGSYLGLCAGGYFACDSIEFDKGGQLAVCGERHLKFYPGSCIGPVYPGFEYNTCKGAVGAPIDFSCYKPWKESLGTINLYTDGGGYFTDQSDNEKTTTANGTSDQPDCKNGVTNGTRESVAKTEVVARFQDVPNSPAAIVKCEVGSNGGKAILTGVHFEYCPELLTPGEKGLSPSVVNKIAETDKGRQLLLTSVLKHLGINTKSLE